MFIHSDTTFNSYSLVYWVKVTYPIEIMEDFYNHFSGDESNLFYLEKAFTTLSEALVFTESEECRNFQKAIFTNAGLKVERHGPYDLTDGFEIFGELVHKDDLHQYNHYPPSPLSFKVETYWESGGLCTDSEYDHEEQDVTYAGVDDNVFYIGTYYKGKFDT